MLRSRLEWALIVLVAFFAAEATWWAVFGYWQADAGEIRAVISCLLIAVFTFPRTHNQEPTGSKMERVQEEPDQ